MEHKNPNLHAFRSFLSLFCFFFFFTVAVHAQSTNWYVTTTGAGNKSGTSWANAANDIQLVINTSVAGNIINVGAGSYKSHNEPVANSEDTIGYDACFYIVNKNIQLLGGFPETGGTARNPSLNKTILRAEPYAGRHVLLTINLNSSTVIDGFEIRDGAGNSETPQLVGGASIVGYIGGGLYNHASSPSVNNCFFTNNNAYAGGGVANIAGSSPTISRCGFANNNASVGGGGYSSANTSTTFNNCVFYKNAAGLTGGAWHTNGATTQLHFNNCTLSENFATESGGGAIFNKGTLTIDNTIFYNNKEFSFDHGGYTPIIEGSDILHDAGGTATIRKSMLQYPYACTTCLSQNNQNPLFRNLSNPLGADNKWGTTDDGLSLGCGSSAINRGDNTLVVGSLDIAGQARTMAAVVDLGAYESDLTYPTISVQPVDVDVCNGNPATFTVTATGTHQALTYQWQNLNFPFLQYADIPNATNATFTIPHADSTDSYILYRCIVTDDCLVKSDSAQLSVNTHPTVQVSPADVGTCPNGSATFSTLIATYDEDPTRVSYQWQVKTSGASSVFTNITGAVDSLLTLPTVSVGMNGNQYRCVGRTDCGSITTTAATLSVKNLVVAYVDATATGNKDGSNWANAFTSLQSAVELLGCVDTIKVAAGEYYPSKDAFKDAYPSPKEDKTFFLSKNVVLLGGYPSGGGTVRNPQTNASILRGSIDASVYHVLMTKDLTNATVIDGFTIRSGAATLYTQDVPTTLMIGTKTAYRTRGGGVYNLAGSAPTFKNCLIIRNTAFEGGGMYNEGAANITLESCVFDSNDAVEKGGSVSNNNTQLTATACVFDNNGSRVGAAILNKGTSQLTLNSSVVSRNINAAITNLNTATVTISNCTVYKNNVGIDNQGGALTINNTIFYDNYFKNNDDVSVTTGLGTDILPNSGPLSISGSLLQHGHMCTGCVSTNNLNPQFRLNTSPNVGSSPEGPDGIWLTADDNLQLACGGPAFNTGKNVAVVGTKDALGNPRIQLNQVDAGAYESAVDAPVIGTHPVNQSLCEAANLTLNVAATGAGTTAYQWQSSRAGEAGFTDINGATNATYNQTNVPSTDHNTRFRCVISNGFCSINSDIVTLTVFGTPVISQQPESMVVCGSNTDSAFFSIASQVVGAQSFQWQVNTGAGFSNISGATDSVLSVLNVNLSLQDAKYRCIVGSSCASVTSSVATLNLLTTNELYVDSTATGKGDGTNWANAFPTLHPAINLIKCGTVTKIHVAKGTYTPQKDPVLPSVDNSGIVDKRQRAFYLTQNIMLLGGYPSGGGTVRNWVNNPTILSGDIGVKGETYDDAYHILVNTDLDSTTIIDGFTFENGHAGSSDIWNTIDVLIPSSEGGIMYNQLASPTIKNCTFSRNTGGIYNRQSTPSVSDCIFKNNAFCIRNADHSTTTLTNCVFSENFTPIENYTFSGIKAQKCIFDGNFEAIYNADSSICILENSVFSKNGSFEDAGLLMNDYGRFGIQNPSDVVVNSCTFYDNYSLSINEGAAILKSNGGSLTVRNSIFYNNSKGGQSRQYIGSSLDIYNYEGGGGTLTIENTMLQSAHDCPTCPSFDNISPQFAHADNPIGADNKWATADDGLQLACGGLAFNAGNNAFATSTTDIGGNPRINFTTLDLGAYEGTTLGVTVTTHPKSDTICLGSTAIFTAAAANATGATYQWQEDAGSGFVNMTGATASTLSIPSVSVDRIGSKFRCLITKGCTTETQPATLTLDSLPSIIRQPIAQVSCLGSDALFSVAAQSSRPITYQWQFNSGSGFQNISGATSDTLRRINLALNTEGSYQCLVSNGCAVKASVIATLAIPTDSVYYVDANALGLNTGKSWANAFTSLQSALDRAQCSVVKAIYVAKGTYVPNKDALEGISDAPDYDTKTFYISTNIRLLGGYPTGGGVRNPKLNPTILQGKQTGVASSSHIVIIRNVSDLMVFDGFHVANNGGGGLSDFKKVTWDNYTLTGELGGGMACINATPIIQNCSFYDNEIQTAGGAIFSALKSPSLISDCIFERNRAIRGGALALSHDSTVVRNCFFSDNWAAFGVAIKTDSMHVLNLSHCVFSKNLGSFAGDGGTILIGTGNDSTRATIKSCTFFNNFVNEDYYGSALINASLLPLTVANSIFYNVPTPLILPNVVDNTQTVTLKNCMIQQTDVPCTACVPTPANEFLPLFLNKAKPKGADDTWGTTDDGLSLACNSPAINAGNDTLVDTQKDIVGKPSKIFAHTDLGAYEKYVDCDNYVYLNSKVFLQGPYVAATGMMTDNLRIKGYLPIEEPYTALGFTHKGSGGGETLSPYMLSKTGDEAIVDWVFLELRDALDTTRVVATRSVLLQRNGNLVDTEGSPNILFSSAPIGNYYVGVRHRNHLSCRTNLPITLDVAASTVINFTNGSTPVLGQNALKTVGSAFAMYAGDLNRDGRTSYNGAANDRVAILRFVGLNTVNNQYFGYYTEDANLDGIVRYNGAANDRVVILSTVGLNSVNTIIFQKY